MKLFSQVSDPGPTALLLMKDVHYRMFYELLREGIPLLSDMNVDMVTFYSVEENKKETVINVLSGRKIYLDLPPVRESQEERIQRLHSIIEDIQLQNIEYRSRIEELSLKMSTKVEIDSIPLSEDVNRAIQDALKEGVSKPTIHRVIELNTKLVETLEEKKSFASEKKLKTALKCAEVEIEALKAKYGVLQEEHTTDKDNIHESTTERDIQAGSDELGNNQRTTDGEATTDIMIDKKEQALLDDLNDSLKRADSLGYSKSVIDQVVVRNGLYVEHKCRKTFQLEIKWLHLDNRLLQDKLIATNSLLQQTANSFGFKQGLMSQIETVFESEGSDIPANKGFMTDVIQLVMELGTMITYDEELKLNSGIKDVPLTVKVKRDRRFLLLRLYYLENLKSDLLILIEAFVSQKLREIKRDDLEERWSQRVMPRDPALKLQELLQKMSLENIPGLPDLFIEISSRLRDRDKALLRKKLPKDDKCQDQDLLQRIMKLNNGDFQKRPDDIPPLVKAILDDINRKDLYIEFEVKFKRLAKALRPELREILRSTCSKISKTKKKVLRRRLKEDTFVEDDDILGCLIQEHFAQQQGNLLVDDVDTFVKQTLREINQQTLYDDFEKLLEKKGLKVSMHTDLQFRIDSAGSGTNKLILEKIVELGEEIKSLKANQKGPHVSADILNPGLRPWSKGLANDESFYRQFFKESVSASGFDFGKRPF